MSISSILQVVRLLVSSKSLNKAQDCYAVLMMCLPLYCNIDGSWVDDDCGSCFVFTRMVDCVHTVVDVKMHPVML